MSSTADAKSSVVLGDLVLVRMSLPSKKPATAAVIRADLGKLLGGELSLEAFDRLRNDLADSGMLARGGRNTFMLTEKGRERALAFLGLSELPARINWSGVIAKHLFPMAADLSPAVAAKLDNGDKLSALVLKRKYDLPASAGASVKKALEAIVCRELGFPGESSLEGLLCAALSRTLGAERLSKQRLIKQVPLFETGLASATAAAVRAKIVSDWLRVEARVGPGAEPAPEAPEFKAAPAPPFDLRNFAATVRELALTAPAEDRFHDNKAFISALGRRYEREADAPKLSLAEFKQRLVEANRAGLLSLGRADLVQAMDPRLVAESETEYLNARFHFVLIEGDRS